MAKSIKKLEWESRNKEKMREYQRAYYSRHRGRIRSREIRRRAALRLERPCFVCLKPCLDKRYKYSCGPAHMKAWEKHSAKFLKFKDELKRKYGLTETAYYDMLSSCGGLCSICHRPPTGGRRLAIDHSHVTGAVRGLLCAGCNSGIGMFGDDADRLESAARYIRNVNPYEDRKAKENGDVY